MVLSVRDGSCFLSVEEVSIRPPKAGSTSLVDPSRQRRCMLGRFGTFERRAKKGPEELIVLVGICQFDSKWPEGLSVPESEALCMLSVLVHSKLMNRGCSNRDGHSS